MAPKLLYHVEQTRLTALEGRLEEISKLSVDFLILLSGSTIIATFGLFQNSPAVVIGAMIIAPLMRPLIGLSLATLTADTKLLWRAAETIIIGTIVAIVMAMLMASIFRNLELTPEILNRTHPTLLDLGVALAAGAIAAYCQAKEELSDTLAGVAISVALVPPLCVVGIGFAFGASSVWTGAALLYATNLIGITVAGAIVFLALGFTPLKQARKGLLISTIAIVGLVVPLALRMRELVVENLITSKVRQVLTEKTFTFRHVQLQNLVVRGSQQPMTATATVLASDPPITLHQAELVQTFLSQEMGFPVRLRLRIIPSTELDPAQVQPEAIIESPPAAPIAIPPTPVEQPDRSPEMQYESSPQKEQFERQPSGQPVQQKRFQ